jgi:hypothetical protein
MERIFYFVAFLIASAISGSAVYAVIWLSKHRQLRDCYRGANSIFDKTEPIGQATDHILSKWREC